MSLRKNIAREGVSFSCCKIHEAGTSIFTVSLDCTDLNLSFMAKTGSSIQNNSETELPKAKDETQQS
jgi:hypothetical protein